MIKVFDRIWIGGSSDECYVDLGASGIGAVLNVAQDLQGTRGWRHGIEYAQVGLIDGPGNPLSTYCAAVLALDALLRRHKVLVVCHTGGRSVAVAIMYLNFTAHTWHAEHVWDKWIDLLNERVGGNLPTPNDSHREAFESINWKLLTKLAGDPK